MRRPYPIACKTFFETPGLEMTIDWTAMMAEDGPEEFVAEEVEVNGEFLTPEECEEVYGVNPYDTNPDFGVVEWIELSY